MPKDSSDAVSDSSNKVVQFRVLVAGRQLQNALIQFPLAELRSLGFLACNSAGQDTTDSMLLVNHKDNHLPKCKVVAFSKNCDAIIPTFKFIS